jgi:CxxC motif-containing protein
MEIIKALEIMPPVKRGQVIVKNILETEADLVACKDIK